MFDRERGWNLSFAGCGFLGVYHVGVSSCLQEKAPYLITEATKIYGASAGALNAAALVCGSCMAQCCSDVMDVAKEARKRNLGPMHPSFNLVKILKNGLYRNLPENAHELASGRLCISLTRVSDGENVLVSEFGSKEELIQALICSSFVPIYCGIIPPTFRGVRYVDGGISNNLPEYELKNTITISPFSGESDICPRDNSTNFHELRVTNTSIQFSLANLYRLTRALFPPEPKILGEMCQQGYNDALRFLKDNKLLILPSPQCDLQLKQGVSATPCSSPECTMVRSKKEEKKEGDETTLLKKVCWPLDKRIMEKLPPTLLNALQEACKEKEGLYNQITSLLPLRVASYMALPCTLPVESAYSLALRLVDWFPDIPDDVRWMQQLMRAVAGTVFYQARKRLLPVRPPVRGTLRKCLSLPSPFQQPSSYLPPNNYSSMDLESWVFDFSSPMNLNSAVCVPECGYPACFGSDDSGVEMSLSFEDADSLEVGF
ncbi:patatin-like phospholipase domain-containing protein 2 [Bufo gargarizans]|uniref:patatin-like phospholipase domain-containing protein 2 n=1 Tax=Bufo gargarizans TaxID=30331 RepID=UPI001CF414AE|nr:patatin-like phospholipase domain-containing protein 2 [Bufo gargarizans]